MLDFFKAWIDLIKNWAKYERRPLTGAEAEDYGEFRKAIDS